MLSAAMRSDYFAELVRHYLLLDKTLRVGLLVATSGSVAAALVETGPGRLIVPVAATAISLLVVVQPVRHDVTRRG
jgi:hypothetical protein